MLAVLALVAFLMGWAFAMFGGPHAVFFQPLVLGLLGFALLAAHLVFGLGVPWRKTGA